MFKKEIKHVPKFDPVEFNPGPSNDHIPQLHPTDWRSVWFVRQPSLRRCQGVLEEAKG